MFLLDRCLTLRSPDVPSTSVLSSGLDRAARRLFLSGVLYKEHELRRVPQISNVDTSPVAREHDLCAFLLRFGSVANAGDPCGHDDAARGETLFVCLDLSQNRHHLGFRAEKLELEFERQEV
jgi:hypothetical protein